MKVVLIPNQLYSNTCISPVILFIHSYPRLFYLTDSTTPNTFDTDESVYNSIAIGLNATYSNVFNVMQYHWVVYSDNAYTRNQFEKGVSFWVINETVLSRNGSSFV